MFKIVLVKMKKSNPPREKKTHWLGVDTWMIFGLLLATSLIFDVQR